jgi:cytochrome b561
MIVERGAEDGAPRATSPVPSHACDRTRSRRLSGGRLRRDGEAFHWLTVAILVVQYAIGWLMPDIKRGMVPGTPMNLHMSIGMVALALVLVRLAWRLAHPVPPEAMLPAWQRRGAEAVHLLLYALLFATLLTGWFYASMRGWRITAFGVLPLPALTAEASPLGRAIGRWHETLTWALLTVIGLHVAAALAHALVLRDRVLQRMLPRIRRR